MKLRTLLLGMCMLGCAMCAHAGVVYNAATDFSATANPNGVWSYGYYTDAGPSSFVAYDTSGTIADGESGAGLEYWHRMDDGNPNIMYNPTDTAIAVPGWGITFDSHTISLGPHQGPSVVRWTAPTSDLYSVEVTFTGIQATGANSVASVWLVLNGVATRPLYDWVGLEGSLSYSTSDTPLQVTQGDVIDFAIGSGTQQTLLDASITLGPLVVPGIPGDANNDQKVDGSDVTILAGNWQVGVDGMEEATWEMGDFNGDGAVDGSDVTILAGNWQAGVTASAASVPEPSTIVLLLGALAALATIRRMKK